MDKTFSVSKLSLTFTSCSNLNHNLKDKITSLATPMCIYQFNCSCGARYLSRPTRRLSKRICEHHPALLGKRITKSITSMIVEHLVDTGHKVDVKTSFKIFYKMLRHLHWRSQLRQLCIMDAIGIRKTEAKPVCSKETTTFSFITMAWNSGAILTCALIFKKNIPVSFS